ncbi:MAG: hypothetical protein AAFU60_00200, partial [Bacteroidota bacterium]
MDKFLQQFKDNLENQPAPEYDQQDWADMQQRLELQQQEAAKTVNYWPWAAAVLLLLTLGSNGLILKRLNAANYQIDFLQARVDTLIRSKVLVRTDTVYVETPGGLEQEARLSLWPSTPSIASEIRKASFFPSWNTGFARSSLSGVLTFSRTHNPPQISSSFTEQTTKTTNTENGGQAAPFNPAAAKTNPSEEDLKTAPINQKDAYASISYMAWLNNKSPAAVVRYQKEA